MSGEVRPSGHLQVVDPGTGRRWHVLWRDAEGRHQKILGPAWVKDSGKRTPRGAVVWRAANGPKPDPSYLTPADAADERRMILARAPRASATGGRRRGPAFEAVAWEWLETEIAELIARAAPQLLAEPGFGPLTAGKLIGEIAGAQRFATDAKLARAGGIAPIPVRSGN
jgi:hypothetical protein